MLFSMPLVSVVIPVYNQACWIGQTLESVFAQTFRDFEVIVVDDGSTDRLPEALAPWRDCILFFSQPNKGPSAARNLGIREAKGEWIALLDADDLWLPHKLERQVELARSLGHPAHISSQAAIIDESGAIIDRFAPFELPEQALRRLVLGNVIIHCTVLAHRKLFEVAAGYDERVHMAEDWDLWTRMACDFPFYVIQEELAQYRVHGGNKSGQLQLLIPAMRRVLQKAFRNPKIRAECGEIRKEALVNAYMYGILREETPVPAWIRLGWCLSVAMIQPGLLKKTAFRGRMMNFLGKAIWGR